VSDTGIAGAFSSNAGKILSGNSNSGEVFSVAYDGTVKTSGSVQASGPVIGPYGAAVPLAFASVSAWGTVQSGTSNVTAAYNSTTKKYEITISGVSFSRVNYTAIATVSGSVGLRGTTVDDDSSGHLVVGIWDVSGNTRQEDFTVVVFQHH
jgi:hypothetical protein